MTNIPNKTFSINIYLSDKHKHKINAFNILKVLLKCEKDLDKNLKVCSYTFDTSLPSIIK